jgi:hypothetical protein
MWVWVCTYTKVITRLLRIMGAYCTKYKRVPNLLVWIWEQLWAIYVIGLYSYTDHTSILWKISSPHACSVHTPHTHTTPTRYNLSYPDHKLKENGTKQNAAVPMGSTCLRLRLRLLLLLILETNLISNIYCMYTRVHSLRALYVHMHTHNCMLTVSREGSSNRSYIVLTWQAQYFFRKNLVISAPMLSPCIFNLEIASKSWYDRSCSVTKLRQAWWNRPGPRTNNIGTRFK